MKLLSTILATTGLVVSGADPSTGLRTLGKKQGRSGGPPGAPDQCTPQALEGVWAHMSQGLEYYSNQDGGGLREWIVTCPRLPLTNGNSTSGEVDVQWGNGNCQIADADKHTSGCGWLGELTPEMMKIDSDYGVCSVNFVTLYPKGGSLCNFGSDDIPVYFNLYFKAIQDHDNMWWLYLTNTNADDAANGIWLNSDNPRHTTRNPAVTAPPAVFD